MDGNMIFFRVDPTDKYDFVRWHNGDDMMNMGGWNGVNLGYTSTPTIAGEMTYVMSVKSDGVGINTSTPQAALEVNGTAAIDGSLGIGTTSPSVKLDIENGNASPAFKLVDGTQQNGYVLTSDGSGNASWKAPGGGGTSYWSVNGNGAIYNNNANAVGILTQNPDQALSVLQGMDIDIADGNRGSINDGGTGGNGITFGASSKEGIASARTTGVPNPYGLDFYTNQINRLAISNSGQVGISTTTPEFNTTGSGQCITAIRSGQ
jgi:hypothetical protein